MRLDNKYVNKTIKEYSQSDAIGFKIDAFKESVNGGLKQLFAVGSEYITTNTQ